MHKKQIHLLIFCILFLLNNSVLACSRGGQMIMGAVAYKEIRSSDSAVVGRILAWLKQHPDYSKWQSLISEQGLAGEAGEMYLFALAARWADDARGTRYDRPLWHYVNLPYVPLAQFNARPRAENSNNILRAFDTNLHTLNSNSSDAEKIIALCWIIHLIGDIHQPLHTTTFFNNDYPYGDRGGNAIFVRITPGSPTIKLHAFWDDLILGSDLIPGLNPGGERFQVVANKAVELSTSLQRQHLSELTEKQFANWAEESFKLAVEYAYRKGSIKGGRSIEHGVVLPDDYVKQTKPVVERRTVLAGYRLADTLIAAINPKK
ncbi:MAG: S1/P1 nuclease [Acidobacteria bacterium]|nr:S1/P1 nuclease [Acidobacteriota bacterium]